MGQETRCEDVPVAGHCVLPWVRYGGSVEGVPGAPAVDDPSLLAAWCVQLGYTDLVAYEYGDRDCPAPSGRLFWCPGYDEPAVHWCDFADGFWFGDDALGNQQCVKSIASITCQ